jgi:hypothetical protein
MAMAQRREVGLRPNAAWIGSDHFAGTGVVSSTWAMILSGVISSASAS